MISRRAQLWPLVALIGISVALLLWVLVFGDMISFWGHSAVTTYGLTGVTAMAMDNINFALLFAAMIAFLMISFGGYR